MSSLDQTIQLFALLIALSELIVSLYILVLNPRHSANRHVSALLILLVANTLAVGTLSGTHNQIQATISSIILAATTPAIVYALLITTLVLLKPNWLQGRGRAIYWSLHGLTAGIIIITLVDVALGTNLWYSGISPEAYTSGFVGSAEYTQGTASSIIWLLTYVVIGLGTLVVLVYLALFDKSLQSRTKTAARILLAADAIVILTQFVTAGFFLPSVTALIPSVVYALAYSYAIFQQMETRQRLQRGSLQVRLTVLIMIVILPIQISTLVFVTNQAQMRIEEDIREQLYSANQALSDSVSLWMETNIKALQNLVNQPDIASMDAASQKPLLDIMANTYSEMYLVSTTDLGGMNLARSDTNDPIDYSDRIWFQEARNGAPLTFQTLIGRTSGQPALVISMPIKDQGKTIVGVGMFATDLDAVSKQALAVRVGEAGLAFVVDQQNQLLVHPDSNQTTDLRDMSNYPPVVALREGETGRMSFTDEENILWQANISELPNGWGIIVQLPEEDMFTAVEEFQEIALVVLLISAVLMVLFTWLIIRQGIQPIRKLTETASAITHGDLTRQAPVETEDELGVLAGAFNMMTAQLRELITNLEGRVTERTRDLERQAVQLQVAADVAREAAAIRDLDQLMEQVVQLISNRFGFYHAAIFLLDKPQSPFESGYAVLQAASSKGGQSMLAGGHKLAIGEVGIVGYVAGRGEPRIALDVGVDAVFFTNPDLPLTRSELALPLIAREEVIGVLDVQSTEAEAFTQDDINILQVLADQVALAIDNARLLSDSRRAVQELENLYRRQVRHSWQEQLKERDTIYIFDKSGVRRLQSAAEYTTQIDLEPGEDGEISTPETFTIKAPIELRGQQLGSLILRRKNEVGPWLLQEEQVIREAMSQIALALENARLLEETQRQATREQIISQVGARVRETLDIDSVLQTTLREIGRVMVIDEIEVRLGSGSDTKQAVNDPAKDGAVDITRKNASDNGKGSQE